MLNRQKALLKLVELAGGEIDRLTLTKWAFLIRQETDSRGGDSFYDFVPYHYGPFSFGLYQEAEKLVTNGYLKEQGESRWGLGDVPAPAVDDRLQHDLAMISSRFRPYTTEDMLDYVYSKYPSFTVNSKRKKLAARPTASLSIYTAGYEGKSIDAFLNGLTQTGIEHLIDVRMNPVARRYGFHRSTLARLCERLGIKYSHVPSLGIPSELRQNLTSLSAYETLFRNYESTTLRTETASIDLVADWMAKSPSVIVCMEAEPQCCHRSRLAEPVSKLTKLPIIHLS